MTGGTLSQVAANKSTLVTKTSTFGKGWGCAAEQSPGFTEESGTRDRHFDVPGLDPSVRYHHDGKYNVLSIDGPFEVYVEKHGSLDFDSVRECLAHIVPLCLDNDPSLIPLSCGGTGTTETSSDADGAVDGPSSDDFTFWSEGQAKRISTAIKEAFDVEYAPDVVMADANLTALAKRILVSKQLLVNS
ncbi:hypothetical protein EDC04DRAFT_3146121 [Pisolithus marmoratus]|nr:hypothetical protein EDC04DRAFT_3146121 [Pisolithus marmoratus]